MPTDKLIPPNSQFTLIPNESENNQRIDKYLSTYFPYYSRTFFQKLIANKTIKHNGTFITKPSHIINAGDKIIVTFPSDHIIEQTELVEKTLDVTIIIKTDHFMIINKPAHLLVHAPSKTSTAITLVNWILHHYNDLKHIGAVDRPGIVHRLDKETSGLMIITRTNHAHILFEKFFKNRTIKKTYHALVEGHLSPEGTINHAIGRHPINRIKMTTFDSSLVNNHNMVNGIKVRHATTHYKVISYFQNSTLVEVKPITGRTHQIRVHMAAIGHPIIGDKLYGKKSTLIDRQALHAYGLQFTFDEHSYSFTTDYPVDLLHAINSQKPFVQ